MYHRCSNPECISKNEQVMLALGRLMQAEGKRYAAYTMELMQAHEQTVEQYIQLNMAVKTVPSSQKDVRIPKGMVVDLHGYDAVLISTSAGKDSLAMMDYVIQIANEQGFPRDQIIAVHADLGRVEWAGVGEIAQRQAEKYGIEFVVTRLETGEDLLQRVQRRGKWPGIQQRWCTSDYKRGPIRRVYTAVANKIRKEKGINQPRLLDCWGLRSQESTSRAKKPQFWHEKSATSSRRYVDIWLPIKDWTEDEVWERIRRCQLEYHEAYDRGMSRLSCAFCIMASKSDLMIAGEMNPELLQTYVDIEKEIDFDFKQNEPIADIQAELKRLGKI